MKAVKLAFRQRECPVEFHRVLCGHYHKRLRENKGLSFNRDLFFIHRLEERGLGFRVRPVNLICKYDVRKNRTWLEFELPALRVIDAHPYDVRRHEITGELYPLETAVHGLCEREGERCLTNTRNTFDEQIASGEQRYDRHLHRLALPFYNRINSVLELPERGIYHSPILCYFRVNEQGYRQ